MTDFANVKVGDEVYVPGAYNIGGSIETVSKVTPATFTAGHLTFHKKDGYQRGGGSWSKVHVRPVTPELRSKVMRAKTIERMRREDHSTLSDKQLEAIGQILDEPREAKAK